MRGTSPLTSPVDIRPDHLEIVQDILGKNLPAGVKVWVFGSRANWTTKDSSDLDLALEGEGKLSHKVLGALKDAFEDSSLPYTVDVVDFNRIGDAFKQIVELQRTPLPLDRVVTYGADLTGTSGERRMLVRFGECASLVRNTVSPLSVGSCPYIGLEHIGENTLSLIGQGSSYDVTSAKTKFAKGDILFGKLRPYFRKVVQAPFDGICSTDIWVVRSCNGVDQRFLYYNMASQSFVDFANAGSTGKKMPRANWSHVEAFEIPLPPLLEQRAIAHILGTLDDKIELNRRMNETLDSIARALFKSWFVDFDPVRAKMAGRDTGLPPHIAALFPDRLVDSELGEIPEGWEVKVLGEVASQRRSVVKPEEIDAESPYIGLEHMPKRCIALTQWSNADGLASSKFKFEQGDILFGKLRPYFHKVGVAPLSGVCSTDIVVVRPNSKLWFGFVLGHTSSPEFVDYTDATSTGTRMPRTNWPDMSRYTIALPSMEVSKAFTRLVEPCVNQIVSATHESHSLAAQRDALLPRLVSGELQIDFGWLQ